MTTWKYSIPSPPLSTCIDSFCFYDGGETLSSGKERCLPDGQASIVINLGHDTISVGQRQRAEALQTFHGGVLHGAFSAFSIIDTATLVKTISVCFKPGGMQPFLRMPATELTNQAVELSTLWGDDACDLREQLLAAPTQMSMVRILKQFLLTRATWEQAPHAAVAFALEAFQTRLKYRSIAAVTDQLGLRPKRFIALFENAVGLTPKVFCRVQRFQDALQRIENEQYISWIDLALDCGYFDQSHFIHDFQAFAGLTPQTYLARRSPYRNHLPLLDEGNFLQDTHAILC